MKTILQDGNQYVLRFEYSEEFIETLKKFCAEKGIEAGVFSGIGAAYEVTLRHFSLSTKVFTDKTFKEELEIVSLIGNISKTEDETTIHAHGAFGNQRYETLSGHVKKLIVSATLEIFLEVLGGKINRRPDPRTGLNLMV